jgi:hypothetical protein
MPRVQPEHREARDLQAAGRLNPAVLFCRFPLPAISLSYRSACSPGGDAARHGGRRRPWNAPPGRDWMRQEALPPPGPSPGEERVSRVVRKGRSNGTRHRQIHQFSRGAPTRRGGGSPPGASRYHCLSHCSHCFRFRERGGGRRAPRLYIPANPPEQRWSRHSPASGSTS